MSNITYPAAFGRLCVETSLFDKGLCGFVERPAAFGRLCVETSQNTSLPFRMVIQPPSGGCVLKHLDSLTNTVINSPAAFGRLCVETIEHPQSYDASEPAAFGRLCVETYPALPFSIMVFKPAAFGRLCVETPNSQPCYRPRPPAAFGRLCVETSGDRYTLREPLQPPSGGCVLKPT